MNTGHQATRMQQILLEPTVRAELAKKGIPSVVKVIIHHITDQPHHLQLEVEAHSLGIVSGKTTVSFHRIKL